jgi:hypothetical protein
VEQALFTVLAISYLNLLFPLNLFMEHILTSKTKRLAPEVSIDFYNECILFFVTIWLQYDLTIKFTA